MLRPTRAAIEAVAAHPLWHYGDPIPDSHSSDRLAHGLDNSAELMAEDHRLPRRQVGPLAVLMKVGTADTAVPDADQHLTRSK